MTDVDAALEQQVFDVPQRQRNRIYIITTKRITLGEELRYKSDLADLLICSIYRRLRRRQFCSDIAGSHVIEQPLPTPVIFLWQREEEIFMLPYLLLSIAIIAEVAATTAMKSSEGFTRLWPSIFVTVAYAISFYFLSLSLKAIQTGIAYAIWAGVGIVLIALIGWIVHKQPLDFPAIFGLILIVSGVMVINVFSRSSDH